MGDARKTLRSGTKPVADGSAPRAAVLSTLEAVPAPVAVVDGRQRVVFVNRRVVHRFGFSTAELVGEPLSQLVPESLRGRGWQAVAEVLRRDRQTAEGIEASARCKDGALRALSLEVGLLEVDGVPLALCILRDAAPARSQSTDAGVEASLTQAQRIAKLGSWIWDLVADVHW